MKYNLKRILHMLLAFALAMTVCAGFAPFAQAEGADTICVGLYYGNNALPNANLANAVGSGFRFGYYDAAGAFIPVGFTELEKITMCKDTNQYLVGDAFKEEKPDSGSRLIGAYHIQPAGEYATFEEAKAAAAAYPYGFPAYINGKYVVRFEFYSKPENAQADAANYPDSQIVGSSATCYTVVDTLTGNIQFEFDGGSSMCLAVQPDITGEAAPMTWFKGLRYYGGFQYNRRNGNDMTVLNVVDTDTYVGCVLPSEFVCSGGIESLKAGAVAIRTYAKAASKHASLGFDVCTTTDCQVYSGVSFSSHAEKAMQAARETSGLCLYYNGKYIEATFYAANGGATETAENTWGYPYPYLIAQEDPYENAISFSSQTWQYKVTPQQVKAMLQRQNYSVGDIVDLQITQYSDTGNVNQIQITDSNGKVMTFSRDNVRILQNISGVVYFSRRFRITPVYAGSEPKIPVINGATTQTATESGAIYVHDGTTATQADPVYIQTKSGVFAAEAPVSVLTADGLVTIQPGKAEEAVDNSSTPTGELTGWILSGHGYGHNVGLSQWGAYAMAEQGFAYDEILKFYYPGTTLG